jgi:transcriptional regulator GlxA family with amidase domain
VEGGPLTSLLSWLRENADLQINVSELAERAAMSPRNFARVFLRETGSTPARYLDQLRLERALALLEESSLPIGSIALKSGFSGEEQFRRTFIRQKGVTPSDYRNRF